MTKKHKYFRNLDYKNKLEKLYDETHAHYPSRVKFITNEPDTSCKNNWHRYSCFYNSDWNKVKGTVNKYEYWNKPKVNYTIIKTYYDCGDRKSYYKKYSNKLIRRTKDIYNHGSYKKVFDLWWTID